MVLFFCEYRTFGEPLLWIYFLKFSFHTQSIDHYFIHFVDCSDLTWKFVTMCTLFGIL